MKKVILGGTFDIIHKGHEALLKKAFTLGEIIKIGLTSDEFAKKEKGEIWNNFKIRKKNLEKFLTKRFEKKPKIIKIHDIFGSTIKEDFDFLICSEETYKNAMKILKERKRMNKKPIKIIKIKMVLAEDGKPISCTRIRRGEIDRKGKLCNFCKIINGEIKVLKLFENKKFLAFLDKNPRNPGHTLVIPKKHFRWVWDIPYIEDFYKTIQMVANGIRKAMNTDWVISPVLGEEVKHAHVHLIPRFENNNFYYTPPKIKFVSKKEMRKIQRKIKKTILKFKNG